MSSYTTAKAKSKGVVVNTKDPLTQEIVSYVKERIETQSVYNSLVAIDYYPLPVLIHFDDVQPLHNGAAETVATLRLTDARDQYVLDGYEITLTNKTPAIIDLCQTTVTTGEDGTAIIRAYGLKEGQARIVATIEYSDDQRKTRLFEEKELTIEVKKPVRYHFEADLLDGVRAVNVRFHLKGDIRISGDCSSDSAKAECDEVLVTSAGGTVNTTATGQDNGQYLYLGLNVEQIEQYANTQGEADGYGSAGNFIGKILIGALSGKMPEDETTPIYATPMIINVPKAAGTYTFHVTGRQLVQMGQGSRSKEFLNNTPYVLPGAKKWLTMLDDPVYFSKIETGGGGPFFSGTITVTEINE